MANSLFQRRQTYPQGGIGVSKEPCLSMQCPCPVFEPLQMPLAPPCATGPWCSSGFRGSASAVVCWYHWNRPVVYSTLRTSLSSSTPINAPPLRRTTSLTSHQLKQKYDSPCLWSTVISAHPRCTDRSMHSLCPGVPSISPLKSASRP